MQVVSLNERYIDNITNNFSHSERLELIVLRARGLYADVCEELDMTDPENDRRCRLLSDVADALYEFIRGRDE